MRSCLRLISPTCRDEKILAGTGIEPVGGENGEGSCFPLFPGLTAICPRNLTDSGIRYTVSMKSGRIAGTYWIVPRGDGASRILVRLLVRYPRGPLGTALSLVLPAGDLVMMRKQLRTLRDCATRV